jgi:subtilisin family serine protease
MALLNVTIIALVLIAIVAFAQEHIIITDGTITSDDALQKINDKPSGLLRRPGPKAKVTRRIEMDDDDGKRKGKKKRFGLVTDLSSDDIDALKVVPGVLNVVPNVQLDLAVLQSEVTELNDETNDDATLMTDVAAQSNSEYTKEWNLDRVDQPFGRDGVYNAANENGKNVDMYIIDTGVKGDHVAFGDRVLPGTNALVTDNEPGNTDCHGHGTHVAGTAAGLMYGIARGATIVPVKILDCNGQGSLISLAAGVSWAKSNIAARGNSRKVVVNLSIQAGGNEVIDDLIRQLYNAGGVVVVAAANFNADACNYSPAREPLAVTVGATSEDDSKLSSSNFGPCVDLFAPGDNIISAGYVSSVAESIKRGTSMASPLVAGIVATIREKFPNYNNQQAISYLLSLTKPIPKRVDDVDCSGDLTGQKIAQTLTAGARITELDRPLQFSNGLMLQGEFYNWSPELTLKPSSGEICVTFNAKVGTSRVGSYSGASVRFAVASSALPTGIVNFLESNMECKDLTTRWYVFDTVGDGIPSLTTKIWDFQNNVLGYKSRAASAELSGTETKQFYVAIRNADNGGGLSLEFGSGNGLDAKNRDAYLTVVDSQTQYTVDSLTKLSFSSTTMYDIEYTNIQSCGGTDGGDPPTPPPTGNGGDGGSPPPSTLTVSKSKINQFWLWPAGWSKPAASTLSCFLFRYNISRAGRILIGLANQALGNIPYDGNGWTSVPAGSHAHVIALSRNTVQLYRDGVLINQQYIAPPIALPRRGSVSIVLKATSDANGLIHVYKQNLDLSWKSLYTFTDSSASFQGTRFALSSSTVRTFANIAVCDN